MDGPNLISCVSAFFIAHPLLHLVLFTQSAGEPDNVGHHSSILSFTLLCKVCALHNNRDGV